MLFFGKKDSGPDRGSMPRSLQAGVLWAPGFFDILVVNEKNILAGPPRVSIAGESARTQGQLAAQVAGCPDYDRGKKIELIYACMDARPEWLCKSCR